MGWEETWIPLFGIMFSLGGAVAIVALVLRFKARKMEHEEILKAIEMGQELPTMEIKKRYNYLNDLRVGVFLIAAGAGIAFFFEYISETHWGSDIIPLGGLGFVALFIGIGFVIMSFVLKGIAEKENRNGNGGNNKS